MTNKYSYICIVDAIIVCPEQWAKINLIEIRNARAGTVATF